MQSSDQHPEFGGYIVDVNADSVQGNQTIIPLPCIVQGTNGFHFQTAPEVIYFDLDDQ